MSHRDLAQAYLDSQKRSAEQTARDLQQSYCRSETAFRRVSCDSGLAISSSLSKISNLDKPDAGQSKATVATVAWPYATVRQATPFATVETAATRATVETVDTVPAWCPLPYPRIEVLPPFGCPEPPAPFLKAFGDFCQQCPLGVPFRDWEQAAIDVAAVFGGWGLTLVNFRYETGDIFALPGGLVWFIKGSPVMAIGRNMAQCRDGRIWRRDRQ
jgi:hypothetical protein